MADTEQLDIIEADYGKPEHADAIVYLLNEYAKDPMGQAGPLAPAVKDRLIEELQDFPTAFSLLAFTDEQAVGLANCFIGYSTFYGKKLINIHDLAVLPDLRNKGIGRHLLEAVQQKAQTMGCCKLTLEVRKDNRAQHLYKRFGFEEGDPGFEFWSKPLTPQETA